MELKAGYKRTEAGVIPADWDVHTIGDCMRLVNGRAFKPGDWKDRGLPIIRIQNLNDTEALFNYFAGGIDERNRIKFGDLLFAWSGTTGTSFGARVWKGPEGVLNQHIFKVIPDQSKLTREYAFLALQKVQEAIEKQAHGFKASFVHVKKSDLVGVELPIPSIESEQLAIATALSDVDTLLTKLDQLITKKRDLKQAAMQQLLTGQTRLPGFSGKWDVVEFGDIVAIRNVKATASSMPVGTRCVELESIGQANGRLLGWVEADGSSSKYSFKNGDVLFGRLRAYLRKHWYAQFDGLCSTEIWPLIPCDERLSAGFLYLIVQTSGFVEAAAVSYGTHMPRSDWSVLGKYKVNLPLLPEQAAIATVLLDIDAELSVLEARREKTRFIKQGMMQELLTGKTRLI